MRDRLKSSIDAVDFQSAVGFPFNLPSMVLSICRSWILQLADEIATGRGLWQGPVQKCVSIPFNSFIINRLHTDQ